MIHRDTPADLEESEPPHIKNWFSSYEYESFVLETNDNFGFSDDQGSQGYANECSTGNTLKSTQKSRELLTDDNNEGLLIKFNHQSEEENKCRNQVIDSEDSPSLSPEPLGIENWFSSYVYESPEVDTSDDLILSDHIQNTVDYNEKAKEFEKDENSCITPDDLTCKQTSECDNGSTHDKNLTELPNNPANVNSSENESINLGESGDGFVSIKSKKENYKNSKQVKGVDQMRGVVSSVNKMKKKSDERVTLGDVTNTFEEHSSVTGKWKCPRKRKPDIGPPLKQLRLGQWFHHV